MRVREIIIDPAKAWEEAATALDRWTRDVQAILNGGSELGDQTRGSVKTLTWTQGTTIALATDLRSPPLEVRLLRGALVTAPGDYVSGGEVSWSFAAGRLTVSDVAALSSSGARYSMTLLVVEA